MKYSIGDVITCYPNVSIHPMPAMTGVIICLEPKGMILVDFSGFTIPKEMLPFLHSGQGKVKTQTARWIAHEHVIKTKPVINDMSDGLKEYETIIAMGE